MTNLFFYLSFLLFSYLLGSFPSSFLMTKLFSGKNILEVGWKKNSSSNVMKNIGLLPGIMGGLLDLFKGYLAVFLAYYFSLPLVWQALAGVAAVFGHNWSIFLHFSGGRGIATFVGILLFFSPKLFLFAFWMPFILVLIWDASPATILLLWLSFASSFSFGQFYPVGLFVLLVSFPIFLKRLSPLYEIIQSERKIPLLESRLLFDDNTFHHSLRIKKLLSRLTKGKLSNKLG